MVQQAFIMEMDPYQRMTRLAQLLEFESGLRQGHFDGVIWGDALSYFEGLYRWATVGRSWPNGDQVKRELELRSQELWGRQSPAVLFHIMPFIGSVVFDPGKIQYPISEWSIGELQAEYVRLDLWRDVYAVVGGIGTAIGAGRTGISLGAMANVQVAQRVATMIGPAGTILSAATMAVALIAYFQVSRTMSKIEEEVQEKRIERGEITSEAWNAIFREMAQN